MILMSKFTVGEYVVRRFDGTVGIVREVLEVPGSLTCYAVEMPGDPGDDNLACGPEPVWSPIRTHAHITQTWFNPNDQPIMIASWITTQSVEERCSGSDGTAFKRNVIQAAMEELPTDQFLILNQNECGSQLTVWDPTGSSVTVLVIWCDCDYDFMEEVTGP